jgi:hypothetical protein
LYCADALLGTSAWQSGRLVLIFVSFLETSNLCERKKEKKQKKQKGTLQPHLIINK